jgi:hypothetical protein
LLWFWVFLALPLFVPFVDFCGFPSSRWPSSAFRWLLVFYLCFMGSCIRTSNFVPFVVNGLIKGEMKKPNGQLLDLIVMSHWLGEVWIQISDISVDLPLSLFHLENRVCLSHGMQVAGAAWWAATRIVAGVGDLVQRTGNGRTYRVLGGRMIGRPNNVVCGLPRTHGEEECKFHGWASKPSSTVCQLFDLKTTGTVFSDLASKSVATVSLGLASKPVVGFFVQPQNQGGARFLSLGLKTDNYSLVIWALKSPRWFLLFGPQNQVDDGLSVAPQNRWEDATAWGTRQDLTACFTWKQVGLGFLSLASRLVEARRRMIHAAPSRRLHRGLS